MDVIITGGNADHFPYLELFVSSLRQNGGFSGTIALCDNAIEGTWDRPGKFREGGSFSPEQLQFFAKNQVEVFVYSELLAQNRISREQIDAIPSPTQRYPHKFIYTTLISKNYLTKAKNICFFDADIYFQKPVQPIFERFTEDAVYIVAERLAIGQNHFLSKWIAHSDFSKLSDQGLYLSTMNQALNYCSGFFGGEARRFHSLVLLCSLLTTNSWTPFFSDQPTLNILKSFFHYPFIELSREHVFHLGEFPKEDFIVQNARLSYGGMESIAVHFNGPTKEAFEAVKSQFFGLGGPQVVRYHPIRRAWVKAIRALKNAKKNLRKMGPKP
ncbi:MAG: hypothetical protein IPG32_10110 [Saprospirales bacterium]|nr:hypothetical protein [Saprospirales bacterium]